jgi:hypothetical protein
MRRAHAGAAWSCALVAAISVGCVPDIHSGTGGGTGSTTGTGAGGNGGASTSAASGGAGGATSSSTATTSSTTSGGTGGGGGDLAPDQIPGLVLWLDSSKGTAADVSHQDRIAVWADQSSHGNNAHSGAYQQDPLLAQSGFKSFDVLKFSIGGSISALGITDDASIRFGTGAFALVFVISELNSQSSTLWSKGGAGGLQVTADTNINVLTPTASAHAFLPNPTGFHIVSVRGPALEIRIDGVPAAGTMSTSDLSATGGDLSVGAGSGANDFAEIDYLQLVAYKGAVTDGQIAGLESYLKTKYGL